MNGDTVKITRMGWSTTPGDGSLFWRQRELEVDVPAPNEKQSSEDGQRQGRIAEKYGSTKGTAGEDMDDGFAASGAAHSLGIEEPSGESALQDTASPLAAATRLSISGRLQNKRAPGWGPSASTGRYSEAAGVSRLRLALQEGKSSVFPQGTFARLAMIPELSGAGGRPESNEDNAASESVGTETTKPLAEEEKKKIARDDSGSGEELPVVMVVGVREGSGALVGHGNWDDDSASAGNHVSGDESISMRRPVDDLVVSKPTDITGIGEGESWGSMEERNERSVRSGGLCDVGDLPPKCFEALPHEQIPSKMNADEVPSVRLENCDTRCGVAGGQKRVEGGLSPPLAELTSVPSTPSATCTMGEGVACRYRRRSDFEEERTTPSPSTAAGSPEHGRRRGLRRASSFPLPPLSPRFGSSMPASRNDTEASCRSAGVYIDSFGSTSSEVGSPDELPFASTRSSSSCSPVLVSDASPAAYGVGPKSITSVIVGVEKTNGSRSSSRSGKVAMRSRNRTALQRGGGSRGGGGHSEICAILGGTDCESGSDGVDSRGERVCATGETANAYTGHDRSRCTIASKPPTDDCSKSEEDEHFPEHRAKRTRQRRSRRRPKKGGEGRVRSGAPSSGTDGGSTSARRLSDNSISDLSDEGFDDGKESDEVDGEAELSPSCENDKFAVGNTHMLGSGGPKFADRGDTNIPPGAVAVRIPNVDSTDRTTGGCSIAESLSVMVAGGALSDNARVMGKIPPQQPKPRITELYHFSPASTTSTSSSFGGHRNRRSSSLSGVDDGAGSGNEGNDEGPLEISLGSSNGTVDTFTEVQASLGSLNLR